MGRLATKRNRYFFRASLDGGRSRRHPRPALPPRRTRPRQHHSCFRALRTPLGARVTVNARIFTTDRPHNLRFPSVGAANFGFPNRTSVFMENGKRLEKNRNGGEGTVLSGAAREGLALLQGLLLCGNCGWAIGVRYLGNGGIYPQYLCNWLRREGLAAKNCMQVRCDVLDAAISEEVLKALQPAELELALAALRELEARDEAILRQWQIRLERADYEVALAERRYQEVDPSNRLVVRTLERRWNDALLQLQELKKQAAQFQPKKLALPHRSRRRKLTRR